MIRPIDAKKLYEQTAELEAEALAQVKKLDPKEEYERWLRWTIALTERTAFKHDVAEAPIVDAVPVVRCKDCKNRMTELFNDKKTMYYCPFVDRYTVNDWYCADGERKDDEIN